MDKFITRSPRANNPTSTGPKRTVLVQSTIESLKGVVVVEEILRLKSKLQLESSTTEELVSSLRELGKKVPPSNVLIETKIGKVVNKLRKHEVKQVAKAAETVYRMWRDHIEDFHNRPLIEVRCDDKTEKMRSSGKSFLAAALELEVSHSLPEALEREVFHQCKRLINFNYRRTMRSLVFTLKHQDSVRKKVLSGELKLKKFVQENKK
ncbi:hypothetical protein ScPMuIL_006384 [Solemya velum]